MTRTIALVAGEASGDQLGGALIAAIRARDPDTRFVGIGGPKMRTAGMDTWWDCEELSVFGLVEVIRHLPRLLKLRRQLRQRLITEKPDVFVGIDAPDFNLGLERNLSKAGLKTIHYVSPTVWAWRQKRVVKIARAARLVLCLFPFEPAFYAGHGVSARYVGHPLADAIGFDLDPAEAGSHLGLEPAPLRIALLPGSRASEVARLAGPMLDAAEQIFRDHPGARFVAPMATPKVRSLFEDALRDRTKTLNCDLVDGQALAAMAASDLVVCASGTATLETMLINRPMVVVYRVAAASYHITQLFRMIKTPYFSLPNILASESLVPELIQNEATGKRIAAEVNRWLGDPAASSRLAMRFDELHRDLRMGAAGTAAEAVLEFLDGQN